MPTDEALDAIAAVSPNGVVEIGAGTGSWARQLHDRGLDVVAYDRWPTASGGNRFVDAGPPWFPVRHGDERVARHTGRTLLLVWPTSEEIWPGDCGDRFHDAGGRTLVFVGEGPGGRTGDSILHACLGTYGVCLACTLGVLDAPCVCDIDVQWRLLRRIAIPQRADADDRAGWPPRRRAVQLRPHRNEAGEAARASGALAQSTSSVMWRRPQGCC